MAAVVLEVAIEDIQVVNPAPILVGAAGMAVDADADASIVNREIPEGDVARAAGVDSETASAPHRHVVDGERSRSIAEESRIPMGFFKGVVVTEQGDARLQIDLTVQLAADQDMEFAIAGADRRVDGCGKIG